MKILAGSLISGDLEVRLLRRGERLGPFTDLKEMRDRLAELPFVPSGDLADFGRGGEAVRALMLAALLTAGDNGGELPEDTGVFGWNGRGCTAENLRFWGDYTGCGRGSARGGLFVATLPTIPFCEAAITLGCRGATAYFRTSNSTAALFELLSSYPRGKCLVGELGERSTCMLLVGLDGAAPVYPDFPDLETLFRHLETSR